MKAEQGRQLADALAATELVLEREHHVSLLDGLAAAAAHELGPPLAIILLTLALALYLTVLELREMRPHYVWWFWWLLLVFMTHFVGSLALRGDAYYQRRSEARV